MQMQEYTMFLGASQDETFTWDFMSELTPSQVQ